MNPNQAQANPTNAMSWRDQTPCITYERSWDTTEEYRTVKLRTTWDDGTTSEVKVPTDDGSRGIEFLILVVIEEFMEAMTELIFDDAERFQQFLKVIKGNTKQLWLSIVQSIPAANQTNARFQTALSELYQMIVGSNQRNVLRSWLETQCKKPRSSTPLEHLARIQEIVRLTNALDGTANEIDTNATKEIYFNSCPREWREDYVKSARDLQNDTVAEIARYMTTCYGLEKHKKPNQPKKRKGEDVESRAEENPREEVGADFEAPDEVNSNSRNRWGEWNLKIHARSIQTVIISGAIVFKTSMARTSGPETQAIRVEAVGEANLLEVVMEAVADHQAEAAEGIPKELVLQSTRNPIITKTKIKRPKKRVAQTKTMLTITT